MTKTQPAQPGLFAGAPFAFADRFLRNHAGQISRARSSSRFGLICTPCKPAGLRGENSEVLDFGLA